MSDDNGTDTREVLVCSRTDCYKNQNGVCNSWYSYQDKRDLPVEQACKNFKKRADFSMTERFQVWNAITRLWLRHYAACGKCDLCVEYATMLREKGMTIVENPRRPTQLLIKKDGE